MSVFSEEGDSRIVEFIQSQFSITPLSRIIRRNLVAPTDMIVVGNHHAETPTPQFISGVNMESIPF
jgi:hypothetical protein